MGRVGCSLHERRLRTSRRPVEQHAAGPARTQTDKRLGVSHRPLDALDVQTKGRKEEGQARITGVRKPDDVVQLTCRSLTLTSSRPPICSHDTGESSVLPTLLRKQDGPTSFRASWKCVCVTVRSAEPCRCHTAMEAETFCI